MNLRDKPLCAAWAALYPFHNLYFTVSYNRDCCSLHIITAGSQLTRAADMSGLGHKKLQSLQISQRYKL